MKSQLLKFLFLFFCLNLSAQIKFEKGYFIDNQNKRTECLIKNRDWISLPNEIEYKLFDSSPVITVLVKDLNELKIDNTSHYYRKYTVLIDKNTDVNEDNFVKETAFLKVLVDGKARVFQYNNESLFFYETQEIKIKQLKYKSYVDNDMIKREDTSFRKELFSNLKCEDITFQKAIKLTYGKTQLVKFFKAYNECKGSDYQDLTKSETKIKFNLKVLAGINVNNNIANNIDFIIGENFFVDNSDRAIPFKIKSSAKPSIVLGIELEVLLPFNKHNWAIFSSPTYQTYSENSTKDYYGIKGSYLVSPVSAGGLIFTIPVTYDLQLHKEYSYSYIELPIGIRRYFYLNQNSKWFLDASYGVILHVKNPVEKVEIEEIYNNPFPSIRIRDMKDKSSSMIKFGTGYTFKGKYTVALNYYAQKQLSNSTGSAFSLLVAYKL